MPRWPLFLAVLLVAACMPYESPQKTDSGEADADGDTDTDADSDAPQLDSSHPGWKDPTCLTCHIPDDHNTDLDPYQCAGCHGSNGAPSGHGGTPPCGTCHGEPHGSDGFPDPDSCQTCHPG